MPDINVEADLNAVNDQLGKLVEELNKVNNARENLLQQVQNLSGVAMYLRGKMPQSEGSEPETVDESVERSVGVPDETS